MNFLPFLETLTIQPRRLWDKPSDGNQALFAGIRVSQSAKRYKAKIKKLNMRRKEPYLHY